MGDRKQLLAALADCGVTPDDYRDIQTAQRLIEKVNARLLARDAPMIYALIMASPHPPRATWPNASEFSENS